MDKLEAIPYESWPVLQQLYTRDWPKNIIPFYLLDNYIRWKKIDSTFIDQNVEIMCLNGDWSDGTFYLLQDNDIFFYSLECEDNEECHLERILSLIQDKRSYFWTNYTYKRHLDCLNNALEKIKWHQTYVESCKFYYMSRQKVLLLKTDIPEGLQVHPLSNEDLEYAHSLYPYRHDVSLTFFKMLHKFNLNYGVYDEDGELLAWCLLHQPNAFTALQVRENKQRMGLGSLLLRYMAKMLAIDGKDSFAIIVDGNEASTNLFLKEGFECIDEVFNIKIEPKT